MNTPQNVSNRLRAIDTICIILVMKLNEYINNFPQSERQQIRRRIADACNCSVSAVKHWATGRNGIPTKYWGHIVSVSGGVITNDDLLNESIAA